MYFGDWPQTIKADNVTINEEESILMGGNIYYSGSDGNYYVRCLENAGSENLQYSNNTSVLTKDFNSYKYFKVEPIKWRVVDTDFDHDLIPETPGKKLLFAETILTGNINFYDYEKKMRWDTQTISKNSKLFSLYFENKLDSLTKLLVDWEGMADIYPNNYKHSKIRAFLNGISYEIRPDDSIKQTTCYIYQDKGFLQTAFTDKAQNFIEVTTVDNSKNSAGSQYYLIDSGGYTIHDYSCENTYDKVFLLSNKEMMNKNYNLRKYEGEKCIGNRVNTMTDYAMANHVWKKYGYGKYFLRSPLYQPEWIEDYYYKVIVSNNEYEIDGCGIEVKRGSVPHFIHIGERVGVDSYNKVGIVPAIVVDF